MRLAWFPECGGATVAYILLSQQHNMDFILVTYDYWLLFWLEEFAKISLNIFFAYLNSHFKILKHLPGLTKKFCLLVKSCSRKHCHYAMVLAFTTCKDWNPRCGMKWRYHILLLYVRPFSCHWRFIDIIAWSNLIIKKWQIPSSFSLQLIRGTPGVGLNQGRKLLNTEKIIFKADGITSLTKQVH